MEKSSVAAEIAGRMKASTVLFLGAGASCPFGLPTSVGFFQRIFGPNTNIGSLLDTDLPVWDGQVRGRPQIFDSPQLLVLTCMRAKYASQQYKDATYDAEEVYTTLDGLDQLLTNGNSKSFGLLSFILQHHAQVFGPHPFQENYRTTQNATGLIERLRKDVQNALKWLDDEMHLAFGGVDEKLEQIWTTWSPILAALSPRSACIPVFTTNYDSVFETMRKHRGFQQMLSFVGGAKMDEISQELDFAVNNYIDCLEDASAKKPKLLYFKLHGSLTWVSRKTNGRIVQERPGVEGPPADYEGRRCIVPLTLAKTSNGRLYEKPFGELLEVLQNCLLHAKRCLVIGFSFRDQTIREIFGHALIDNPGLELHVFLRSPQKAPLNQFQQYGDKVISHACTFGEHEAVQEILKVLGDDRERI